MPPILLAHAQGEDAQVEAVADALRSADYDVVYEGAVLVGESLVQEASAALAAGSPVVLCGTVTAMGTGWAHQVVNAARTYPAIRVFGLQMEQLAYLQPLTLDSRVAKYWQDPGKTIADLLEALHEFYPTQTAHKKTDGDDVLRRYSDLALRTNDIVDLANLPVTDKLLSGPDARVRYCAVRALGQLGDPRAVEPLIELLSAPDSSTHDAAADALGELGDPRAVEPLIKLLSGRGSNTRNAVASALGRLGDPRAIEPLLATQQTILPDRSFLSDRSFTVQAALATLGYHPALRELQDLMHGPSAQNRWSACWALATCEHEELHRVLLSRDADGSSPGIDPDAEITQDDVERYAVLTQQIPDKVRRAYEHLQEKYLLRLSWRSPQVG